MGGALYVNYCSGRWLSCRGCWSDTQFLTALEGHDFPALLEPSPQQLSSLPWGNTGSSGPISAMFFSVHFPVWNLTFTELKVPLGREFHHLCGAGVGEGTKLCVVSQIFFFFYKLSWGSVYSSSPGFNHWESLARNLKFTVNQKHLEDF